MEIAQVCSKCNIEKEISMFHKRKDVKTGYIKDCKECQHKQTVNTREIKLKSLYMIIFGIGKIKKKAISY